MQVNGKLRDRVQAPAGASREELEALARTPRIAGAPRRQGRGQGRSSCRASSSTSSCARSARFARSAGASTRGAVTRCGLAVGGRARDPAQPSSPLWALGLVAVVRARRALPRARRRRRRRAAARRSASRSRAETAGAADRARGRRGAAARRLPAARGRAGGRRGPPRRRRQPPRRPAALNLAAKLEDGRQVVVPVAGRGAAGRRAAPAQGAPLDLNTATPEQLDELDGIGPAMAAHDPRVPRAARRLRLGRGARPGPGHRREAPRGAAGEGPRVSAAGARPRGRRGAARAASSPRRTRGTSCCSRSRRALALGPVSPAATLVAALPAPRSPGGAARRAARGRRGARRAPRSPTPASPRSTPGSLARDAGAALGGHRGRARARPAPRRARVRPRRALRRARRGRRSRGCACGAPGRAARRGAVGRPAVGDVVGGRAGRVAPLGRVRRVPARAAARTRRSRSTRFAPTGARRGGVAGALDGVRRRAEAGLARGLPGEEAALLRGMVLGQDEALTRGGADRLPALRARAPAGGQRARTSMLLAMLVLGAGWSPGCRLRARLALALALIALYVPLAGGGPSIQRAGVMGAAGLVAALAGRPASRWYALGLAAAVTLALNPRASGEPGWQLSFAAVVGLLALAPRWREALRRARAARAARGRRGRDRGGDARHRAADGAALRARLARVAAGEPRRRARGRAGDVARHARDRASRRSRRRWRAAERAQRPAARLRRLGRARRAQRRRGGAAGPARRPGRARAARTPRWPRASCSAAARRAGGARLGAGGRGSLAGRRASPLVAVASLLARACARGPPRRAPGELIVSFLDVGQGDATLIQRGGASLLVDTGPPGGADPAAAARGRASSGSTRCAHPRPGRPRGDGLDVIARVPAAARARRRRRLADARCSAALAARARRSPPTPARRCASAASGCALLWPPRAAAGLARPTATPTTARSSHVSSVGRFDVLLPADAESDGHRRARAARASRRSRSPTTAAPTRACRRCSSALRPAFAAIEVGARQHLRPPDARRRSRRCARRCRTSSAPTATAPCACA